MRLSHSAMMIGVLSAVLAAGCATLPSLRPEPPEVSIAGVRPISLSLSRQELEFRLRVTNPNAFDLPIEELDFTAEFAGERIARGRSRQAVTLPAHGERIFLITVDAGFGKLLGRFQRMLDQGEFALDYAVSGNVRLANWPRVIPFGVVGELNDTQGQNR